MAKINPIDFIHENDRKALEALKAVPGFTPLMKGFMKVFSEKTYMILNMSSKIRCTPEQFPRLYNLLVPICEKFEIEVPDLFLELNPQPNAYTSGDTYIFITVTSGLLDLCTDEEIQTILAHECGHIICHHVLYHTMGQLLLKGGAAALGVNQLFTTALEIAFTYWIRCSEFSADRASALFTEDPQKTANVMLRLAGGYKSLDNELQKELFMQQATEYKEYIKNSTWNKVLEFLVLKDLDHPLVAVRAYDVVEWGNTPQYQRIIDGLHGVTPAPRPAAAEPVPSAKKKKDDSDTEGPVCPSCGKHIEDSWAFCKSCGTKLK